MSIRRLSLLACAALWSCVPAESGLAIPAPTSRAVHDAGSVISVAIAPANGCPATSPRRLWGAGTLHGSTVTAHERWTREGSPHRLPNGLHLLAGSTLTVAPCAVVLVGAGRDIVVQGDTRLRAEGTATEPIVFGSASERPNPGDWIGFEIRAQALPGTRFAYATIEHAGAEPSQRGDPRAAIRSWQRSGLDVDHATVRASTGAGIALLGDAGFSTRSRALQITGIQGIAAVFFANADAVQTLPEGEYTGNESNTIFVAARDREVNTDGVWRNPGPGVSYRIRRSARIMVQGSNAPRLVIAPATTVTFEEDAELDIGADRPGALVADGGDVLHRIVFAGVDDSHDAGRWVGVVFGGRADLSASRLRFVRVEGAGARATGSFVACPLGDGAPIEPSGMIFVQGIPDAELIEQTEFVHGPPEGMAIFASGDSPRNFVNFTAPSLGNIFATSGVRCEQNPTPREGTCPTTWRCHGRILGADAPEEARVAPASPPNGFVERSQR